MTLVRWDPFWRRSPLAMLETMQRQMNRWMEEFFREEGESLSNWVPRVDLVEHDDHLELKAELPGLSRDDVKVELNNGVLTISGEKKEEYEKKDRNIYICERSFGSFHRSFQLPVQVDASKIDAQFKNGLLTIRLPKVEEAKPKKIEIKVS